MTQFARRTRTLFAAGLTATLVFAGCLAGGAAPAAAEGTRGTAQASTVQDPLLARNVARTPTRVTRVSSSPSAAGARVPVSSTRRVVRRAEPRTATELAAIQGLSYSDMRTHVLLQGATLRVRLYPGTNRVVVGGREYTVKDRVTRSGSAILLTSRVSRFLQSRIYQYRAEEAREKKRLVVAPTRLEPLPPLPVRKPIVRKVPKVDVTPAARPPQPRPAQVAARAGRDWEPRTNARNWKWIVLHHSDDESGDMAKYHAYHLNEKGWENGCGYHFVIGNGSLSGDGEVEVGPRWPVQLQGAHCKVPGNRYNEHGVGICLVGDFEQGTGRPSAAQLDALVNLVRWLKQRYGIADDHIMGHCDACSTCCPGKNFPWAEFRRRIAN